MLQLTDSEFYTNANWSKPLNQPDFNPGPAWVDLFDQNGYRLTDLEALYAKKNQQESVSHRAEHCIKKDWFTEPTRFTGAHINHAALFERKGYEGEAKEELEKWAVENNQIYKLLRYRAKWGVDFSIDYVDEEGNALEVFHFEYDAYNLDEILSIKERVEKVALKVDWNDAAKALIQRKSEWHHLDFFQQSDWKCAFFGMPSDRFKMVAWE